MNKPHKHAKLIKAWADGAVIETFDSTALTWYTTGTPLWNTGAEFRIKPEPKWYDNIPEQGVLCFVSDLKDLLGFQMDLHLVLKVNGYGDYVTATNSSWKYARPVTLEEIQHLIYKGEK